MKITKKLLAALMAAVMLLSAAPLAGLNLTAEAANSSSKFTTDVTDSLFRIPKSYTYLSFSEFMGTAG